MQPPPTPQVKADPIPEQPAEIPKVEELPKSDPIDIPCAAGPDSDMSEESSDEEVEEVPVEVPKEEEEDTVVVEEIVNNTGLPIELSGLQIAECTGWKYIPYIL